MICANSLISIGYSRFFAEKNRAVVSAVFKVVLPISGLYLQMFQCPFIANFDGFLGGINDDYLAIVSPC